MLVQPFASLAGMVRRLLLLLAVVAPSWLGENALSALLPPSIFNYGIQYLTAGQNNPLPGVISYMPFAGNSYQPSSANCTVTWNYQWTNGLPVTAFYLDSTSPLSTSVAGSGYVMSNSLADTLSWFATNTSSAGIPLNDIMMDDEPYAGYGNNLMTVSNELLATVKLVRANANPNVSQAHIGDYAIYPGGTDPIMSALSRIGNGVTYSNLGLNIAQPNAYPYNAYTNNGPTWRSGYFWSDLELVSFAKTNLPAGHLLIPWVDSTLSATNLSPTRADDVALLGHMRLRGVDGFCDLGGLTSLGCLYGWTDWDWLMNGNGSTQLLNLATSEATGFQWSGFRVGTNVGFLFCNLGNTAATVALPGFANVPAASPTVPASSHWAWDFINDPANISGSTIYLGRDGINHGLFVNATGTLTNAIMVSTPGTNPPATVTIGTDLAGNYAPVFSGPMTLSNNVVLQNAGTNSLLFSGPINGGSGLTNTGSGATLLTGNNSFSGGATVVSGTLQISSPAAIGSGIITLPKTGTNSGTLQLAFTGSQFFVNQFNGFNSTTATGDSTVPDIENLSGTTLIIQPLTVTSTGGNGLAIKATGGLLKLEGTISTTLASREVELNGAGSGLVNGVVADGGGGLAFGLVKDGTGTWTLAGANTYTGNTTVNNGNLQVSGSLALGSAVTVNANGTLSGAGVVGGPVTVKGAITPGNGVPGTLTTSNETWTGGGVCNYQLNSPTNASGQSGVQINGTLTLPNVVGSAFTIRLISLTAANSPGLLAGFNPTNSYSWTIATASGGIVDSIPTAVLLNTSAFSNAFTGTFSVSTNAHSLLVNYTPPPPVAPVVQSFGRPGAGLFNLSFTAASGQSYSVLTTTNLAWPLTNWLVLSNGLSGNGTLNFTDATATNVLRFYRLSSP